MSERRFWIVKPVVNGFETNMIMYGTQEELEQYVRNNIGGQVNYIGISSDIVNPLTTIGMKIYMCPTIEEETDNLPPAEDYEDDNNSFL